MRHEFDFDKALPGRSLELASLKGFKLKADFAGKDALLGERVKLGAGRTTGTTVLAMLYRNGAVIAGDRRATNWHTHEDDYSKIEYIGNDTMIACAGTVSYIQELVETLKWLSEYWEDRIEEKIYVGDLAKLLKNILKANFESLGAYIYWLGYYAVPIMAGYDPKKKRGRVFEFDETGGIYEKDYYAVSGSGGRFARIVLEDRWSKNLAEKDAARLAVRAIARASYDIYTSHPALAAASVFSVSSKGVAPLQESEALTMAWDVYKDDLERHGRQSELDHFFPKGAKQ